MEELKELYHEMWRALLAKDIATLERIHAEEFVLTHMTGMKQPREEYFRCVRDSELNYFSETTEKYFCRSIERAWNFDGAIAG